jgi:hypothetical protein
MTTILCDDSSIEELEDQLLLTDGAITSMKHYDDTTAHAISPPTTPTGTTKSTKVPRRLDSRTNHSSTSNTTTTTNSSSTSDIIRTISLQDYVHHELPRQNLHLQKRDMADLQYLHEAAILYNLKERHKQSQPYTRVGDIVVAMNPCIWMDHLYTDPMRNMYAQALIWQGTGVCGCVRAMVTKNKIRHSRRRTFLSEQHLTFGIFLFFVLFPSLTLLVPVRALEQKEWQLLQQQQQQRPNQ